MTKRQDDSSGAECELAVQQAIGAAEKKKAKRRRAKKGYTSLEITLTGTKVEGEKTPPTINLKQTHAHTGTTDDYWTYSTLYSKIASVHTLVVFVVHTFDGDDDHGSAATTAQPQIFVIVKGKCLLSFFFKNSLILQSIFLHLFSRCVLK